MAMNDHACMLIWDAHTRMGHNIVPYAYGISHTRMGRPIRVWANIRIWGRTYVLLEFPDMEALARLCSPGYSECCEPNIN